ncbi:hypothetical protein HanHA300_Chr05g0179711 [Helianthus annuus]|nr:hypothetical protein HanHA300_Chr05g0179711 [Helianthus annuus]KAJ0584926.1 hypothetical protein HanHA89_Chr05g0194411 [Helianthus annuus]KAJ0750591.1 hypothetical protein HanLR1_Chr05g0183761 [Helianthus annuus]
MKLGILPRIFLMQFNQNRKSLKNSKRKWLRKTNYQPIFKVFENSTFEVGECSKSVCKRKEKLNNQKWVVKNSSDSSGDESDSTKSEESQVVMKEEKSVPPLDDANFPPLRAKNLKSKIGKVEISNFKSILS